MTIYRAVGIMSGTSLDGVDLAFCEFELKDKWSFKLVRGETIPYDDNWRNKLKEIHQKTAEEISVFDCAYGSYLGKLTKSFVAKNKLKPDFVSSHGHTIFHQPHLGYTRQIGSGAHIAAESGLMTICDFRSMDVALGGQGAPLVPIGDKHLFSDADYCLNLGGIANVSFEKDNERRAFDICGCNMVLNHYAKLLGKEYDKNGAFASSGKINEDLLKRLNSIPYYKLPYPKSLGREDVERDVINTIRSSDYKTEDVLSTFCEHIADQVANVTRNGDNKNKMLITGGGALNKYLVSRIFEKSNAEIIIPSKEIIDFKEAIIFGFLGVLRLRNEVNCLRSVTGSRADNCGGAIYNIIANMQK